MRTAGIVVGDCSAIGVGFEAVVGAGSGSQAESDTMPDMRPERLVEARGDVGAELLLQLSSELVLKSVREALEIGMGQIAPSDSLLAVLDSFLATVVEPTASDSSSVQQCSAAETASDSTPRATGSDSLLAASCARTSRRARRPSLAPNSAAALVVATSPARLHARQAAASSLRNPFLKTY